jgi:hypothetical protein
LIFGLFLPAERICWEATPVIGGIRSSVNKRLVWAFSLVFFLFSFFNCRRQAKGPYSILFLFFFLFQVGKKMKSWQHIACPHLLALRKICENIREQKPDYLSQLSPVKSYSRFLLSYVFSQTTCDAYISLVTLKSHSYIHKLMIE